MIRSYQFGQREVELVCGITHAFVTCMGFSLTAGHGIRITLPHWEPKRAVTLPITVVLLLVIGNQRRKRSLERISEIFVGVKIVKNSLARGFC